MNVFEHKTSDRVTLIDIYLSIGIFIIFVPYVYYRVGGIPSIIIALIWFEMTGKKNFHFITLDRYAKKTLFWILIWVLYISYRQFTCDGIETDAFAQMSIQTLIWSYLFWFIAQYYIGNNQLNRFKFITLVALCGFMISATIQFQALLINPYFSRSITGMAGATSSNRAIAEEAYKLGVGGFDILYAIILLSVPIIFTFLKSKPPIRYLFLVAGLLLMAAGFQATYTIGTLSMILAFLIILLFHQRIMRPVNFLIASVLLILFFQVEIRDSLVSLLNYILQIVSLNAEYAGKIQAIQNGLTYLSLKEDTIRFDQYGESIDGFLKNPLFGDISGLCGGHSAILDSLARFGLIGTIPWIMIIFYFTKQTNQSVYKNDLNKIMLGNIFLIPWIFTLFFNPTIGRTVYASFFLIIPGLSLFIKENIEIVPFVVEKKVVAPLPRL